MVPDPSALTSKLPSTRLRGLRNGSDVVKHTSELGPIAPHHVRRSPKLEALHRAAAPVQSTATVSPSDSPCT